MTSEHAGHESSPDISAAWRTGLPSAGCHQKICGEGGFCPDRQIAFGRRRLNGWYDRRLCTAGVGRTLGGARNDVTAVSVRGPQSRAGIVQSHKNNPACRPPRHREACGDFEPRYLSAGDFRALVALAPHGDRPRSNHRSRRPPSGTMPMSYPAGPLACGASGRSCCSSGASSWSSFSGSGRCRTTTSDMCLRQERDRCEVPGCVVGQVRGRMGFSTIVVSIPARQRQAVGRRSRHRSARRSRCWPRRGSRSRPAGPSARSCRWPTKRAIDDVGRPARRERHDDADRSRRRKS